MACWVPALQVGGEQAAMMLLVPGNPPVTIPEALTVATGSTVEIQFSGKEWSVMPLVSTMSAVKFAVAAWAMLTVVCVGWLVTWMLIDLGAQAVKGAARLLVPLRLALIWVATDATAVATLTVCGLVLSAA